MSYHGFEGESPRQMQGSNTNDSYPEYNDLYGYGGLPPLNSFPQNRIFPPDYGSGSTGSNNKLNISSLCGQPAYCQNSIYKDCVNTSVFECASCSIGLAITFIFFVVCLGLAITLGNVLIMMVGYKRYKKAKNDKMDFWKTSLAFANMLTGIHILTVVVYNFSWSLFATPEELDDFELESRRLTGAYVAGILYLFGFTASIYHLCYMSGLRLFAIVLPFKYKMLESKSVIIGLVIVWLISAVSATVPGWFPSDVSFAYQVSLFMFFPTLHAESTVTVPMVTMALFYILPYTIMTTLTIATAVIIRKRQRKQHTISTSANRSNSSAPTITRREVSIFVTILIMQFAFTLALIPNIVIISLYYGETLHCSSFTIPFVISAYFSMSNSLVNVIIYSVREKNFRLTAKNILLCCISNPKRQESKGQTSRFSQQLLSSKQATINTTI